MEKDKPDTPARPTDPPDPGAVPPGKPEPDVQPLDGDPPSGGGTPPRPPGGGTGGRQVADYAVTVEAEPGENDAA